MYRCPKAIIKGAMDPIQCKTSGTVCAHQKMCLMEGKIVLTAHAVTCPGRDMEEDWKEPENAKKTTAKKTGGRKSK